MKRDNQLEPMLRFIQGLRRRSPSQENKPKTERDHSPNVTSRNTSTNDLSNEEPTSIEKKI